MQKLKSKGINYHGKKKKEDSLRPLGIKHTNIHIIGVQEEKRERV